MSYWPFSVYRAKCSQISARHRVDYGETVIEGTDRVAVPLTAVLGDQQAAMVGQVCLRRGEVKNTYGTGNFLLSNTGGEIVASKNGLLTTLCYQTSGAAPVYALEGSIAVTGSAVQWLRDQLGIITAPRRRSRRSRVASKIAGAFILCRRSRACSPRTGAPTHAGP